jgi:hypothetical protein
VSRSYCWEIRRSAASLAPSGRTLVATTWAWAATSGWRVWLRAVFSESTVGASGAWAVPIPRLSTPLRPVVQVVPLGNDDLGCSGLAR